MYILIVHISEQDFYLLSHTVFQDTTFSRRLPTYNCNLRQIDDTAHAHLRKSILHFVDKRDEGLHALVAGHNYICKRIGFRVEQECHF